MNKTAFIVMIMGAWGRGANIKQAALVCRTCGGRPSDRAVVYFITGDDKPEVDINGYIVRNQGSENYLILKGLPLRRLTGLPDQSPPA